MTSDKDADIEEIKKIILKTTPAERIYLFGSFASGTPTDESDYDFYVVIPNNALRPLDVTQNIYRSLRGLKRRSVDILVGYSSVFETRSELPTLERTIKREGVVLYECDGYR